MSKRYCTTYREHHKSHKEIGWDECKDTYLGDVIAERDRYKEALEKIVGGHMLNCHQDKRYCKSCIARSALAPETGVEK